MKDVGNFLGSGPSGRKAGFSSCCSALVTSPTELY